jgi:hypothetical protein
VARVGVGRGVSGSAVELHRSTLGTRPAGINNSPLRRNGEPSGAAVPRGSGRGSRVPWAELLRRVFATDVLACPYGSRRRVVAVVVDSAITRTVLAALVLPCTPATFAPARAPPQAELWFDDAS